MSFEVGVSKWNYVELSKSGRDLYTLTLGFYNNLLTFQQPFVEIFKFSIFLVIIIYEPIILQISGGGQRFGSSDALQRTPSYFP